MGSSLEHELKELLEEHEGNEENSEVISQESFKPLYLSLLRNLQTIVEENVGTNS